MEQNIGLVKVTQVPVHCLVKSTFILDAISITVYEAGYSKIRYCAQCMFVVHSLSAYDKPIYPEGAKN